MQMELNTRFQAKKERQKKEALNERPTTISPSFSETVAFRSFVPVASSIPTLPAFPVDDFDASAIVQRNKQHSSVSVLGQSGSSDIGSFLRSQCNVSNISKHGSVCVTDNSPECIVKAINMVQSHPIMAVKNTAFSKVLSSNSPKRVSDSGTSMHSSLSLTMSDNEKMGISGLTNRESSGSLQSGNSFFLLAACLKRACMWETIIVNHIAQNAWLYLFRYSRLRAVLEKLMLPVILRRRGSSGTALRKVVWRARRNVCEALADDEGEKPEIGFFKQKLTFLSGCCNLTFFEELSESVLRYRYFSGSAIVTAGSPAQDGMYILLSGRCDAIVPATDGGKQPVRRIKVAQGESFGGIYAGSELFTMSYRAVSECIVWVIRRENFEMVFDQHADESMKTAYLEALKEYNMKQLLKKFPLPQCMSRVPIYRLLDVSIEEYAKDFTPLVLTKGDVLFHQGDPPGSVYCLLEGQVERAQLGADMTYETGTRQILSLNDPDNSFALSTRFVLLGEEPHILPSPLRYRCTVVSRCALFFKIDGERFVNALLDDARLFLQIREKLTTQTCLSMKLSPEAILSVPLFSEWPRSQINVILGAAEPRLVDRCISICEPAQPIREIFLLTAGGVRDPRQFDRMPLQPSLLQNITPEDSKASLVHKQGVQARCHNKPALNTQRENGNIMNTCSAAMRNFATDGHGQFYSGVEEPVRNWSTHCIRWSLFCEENKESKVAINYPDEHQDLSPPLPPNPTKSILYAIGGGWEGLLVDKWPSGWETTTTVELWAVPTVTIRKEYECMSKSLQSVILQKARLMQMTALGLSAPLVAKLPPTNVLVSPERRHNKHGLGIEKSVVQERSVGYNKSVASNSRRFVSSGYSHGQYSATTGSKQRCTTGEISTSRMSTLSGSSVVLSNAVLNSLPKTKTKSKTSSKVVTKTPVRNYKKSKSNSKKKKVADVNKAATTPPIISPVSADSALVVEVQKPKAGPPPVLFYRRRVPKPLEKPPVITPELCAIYAGQQPHSCIVREPQQFKSKRGLAARGIALAADQQPSWPVSSEAKNQWFRKVPTFVPLPGKINNKDHVFSKPPLVQNSALMIKREKGYDGVLSSQANYFVSLAHSRREKNAKNAQSLSQFHADLEAVPFQKQEVLSSLMSRPVPGRHAYRF